jgi:hypothetical protein
MPGDLPLVLRFLSKFVLDILPAAFASVIGGFLFTQYHFGRVPEAKALAVQAEPASAEMMQLVRDEHALIVDVLKTQVAAEKTRLAAEQAETARAVAEAMEAKAAAMRRMADAGATAKVRVAPRPKAHPSKAAEPVQAPLVIAQQPAVGPSAPPAPVQAPIRSRTAELADDVVAGTKKVAAAIVGIPGWVASLGERLGRPPARNPEQEGRFASVAR